MSHKPRKSCTDFHECTLCAFFWGEGLTSLSYSQSYLNPKVIESTSAWIPYTVIGANKLRDAIFFFPEFNPGSEIMALHPSWLPLKMSFACGLLGKCHPLSEEQRGPVSVMYHLETWDGAKPVAILSHPDRMLQPHPETYREGE